MAVKYPVIKDGMYCGRLSEGEKQTILNIRGANVIPGLKNMLFDIPLELIARSLDEGRSIREILKEEGEDILKYLGELRDYQTVGTAFLYASKHSILADGVGLGKTAEIGALINFLMEKHEMSRFLIAVETTAIAQTQIDLMRFTGLYIVALPSEGPKMKRVIKNTDWTKVRGIIIKHGALRSSTFYNWISVNLRNDGKSKLFNTLIIDESSVIKNNKTKTYECVETMCDIVDRVHLMNATVFETNIMDIYYQIDMIDKQIMPKKWRIEKKYCKYNSKTWWTKNSYGEAELHKGWDRAKPIYKNQSSFKESLQLIYFGRCKKDVGLDRPNIYKVYKVDPSNDQALALAKGYRYMEVLNSPENIPELNIKCNRKSVPKLERLCQLLETDFASESVMVYCFHLNAQDAIKNELEAIGRKCVILNGSDQSKDKDINRLQIMDDFNRGKYDVIITNIKRSLNLYGGDVCIFYSMETNPSRATQIAGRIDRNVDEKLKTFILLMYGGTDEENMFKGTVQKREMDSRELTIDAEGVISHFMEAMEEQE